MNALWNRQLGKNVRILLSNNDGGAIMHMLIDQNWQLLSCLIIFLLNITLQLKLGWRIGGLLIFQLTMRTK